MTYNVFSGTLNHTQSINLRGLRLASSRMIRHLLEGPTSNRWDAAGWSEVPVAVVVMMVVAVVVVATVEPVVTVVRLQLKFRSVDINILWKVWSVSAQYLFIHIVVSINILTPSYFAHGSGSEVLSWACLCVCLSTRISPEPQVRSLPTFLCMLPMAVAWSSSGRDEIPRGRGSFGHFLPSSQSIVEHSIWGPYKNGCTDPDAICGDDLGRHVLDGRPSLPRRRGNFGGRHSGTL